MAIYGNYSNTNNINLIQQQGISFKQNTHTVTKLYPNDKYESQTKETKSKKTRKWLTWSAILAVAIATVAYIKRIPIRTVHKKIKTPQLAEHIEFKNATTVDEARQFMKDTLKIESIDDNLDLDTLNWINHGLVDVSNSMKGKAKMPSSVVLENLEDAIADMNSAFLKDEFGRLRIDKKHLNNKTFLDKQLFYKGDKIINSNWIFYQSDIELNYKGRVRELMNKYYNNKISFDESMELSETLRKMSDRIDYIIKDNPMGTMEQLSKDYPDLRLDLKKLGEMSKEEQTKKLKEVLERLRKQDRPLNIEVNDTRSGYETIYHELGHLQDFIAQGEKINSSNTLSQFDNRYWRIDQWEKYIKEHPEKNYTFDMMPDLKEFAENQDMQRTAGEVSQYAKEGIGEFIAETYAAMQEGRDLSDNVKQLYKKYNGPLITNPVKTKKDNIRLFKKH